MVGCLGEPKWNWQVRDQCHSNAKSLAGSIKCWLCGALLFLAVGGEACALECFVLLHLVCNLLSLCSEERAVERI